uniref:Beta-glucuronidase n=1 Tax=Rhabditophanes sp. KR3021 TaxID=114890 RepID=A0AC35TFL1_9BILA
MPVPSAFNDLGTDAGLRDHVGWCWYQTSYTLNLNDCKSRTFLRFGSVNYAAFVFVNGKQVMSHIGGHLPFENEITFKCGSTNQITVAVNNTLSANTIPPAEFTYKTGEAYPPGFFVMTPGFDFFNYAGILRSVYVVKVGRQFVQSIKLDTNVDGSVLYEVKIDKTGLNGVDVVVSILDGVEVLSTADGETNGLKVVNPKLWWPRGYGDANLYTFKVHLKSKKGDLIDAYEEVFGFRKISFDSNSLFINDKKFYCLGFGMHEDSELRGRGFDRVVMTKDLNLLEWTNGNCYRTSHYPYDEERAYEADRRGIAVITETPGVGLKYWNKPELLELHKKMVREMITRDKNHPSVIAWSMANEPWSATDKATPYFDAVIKVAREMDSSRPITAVYGPTKSSDDKSAHLLDFICINRYYGWYINMGKLSIINSTLSFDLMGWKNKFDKAIMLTEYGADSLPSLSSLPSSDFTTEYQDELLVETHKALDFMRARGQLAGEMIWNFADFMTDQALIRALGNRKGIFTRQRQPKPSAFILKKRYEVISKFNSKKKS